MKAILRACLFAIGLISTAAAQVPPPVPALPDSERRTSYSISGTTCACSVGFQLYEDGTDVDQQISVWINGVQYLSNDSTHGWGLTSATGPLGSIPRPITDAVLTFVAVQTGTVQIVGAARPRRLSQFQTTPTTRDFNQVLTYLTAAQRERWDLNTRTLRGLPSEVISALPSAATRANSVLGFDATGLIPTMVSPLTGIGTVVGPSVTVSGHLATWNSTNGTILGDTGIGTGLSIGAGNLNISNTGVGAATYGDSTHVPQITVNAQGQISVASNVVISSGSTPALAHTHILVGNGANLAADFGALALFADTGGMTLAPSSGDALTITTASGTTAKGINTTQVGPSGAGNVGSDFLYNTRTITNASNAGGHIISGMKMTMAVGGTNSAGAVWLGWDEAVYSTTSAQNGDVIGRVMRCSVTVVNSGSGGCYGANSQAIIFNGGSVQQVSGHECDVRIDAGGAAVWRFGCATVSTGVAGSLRGTSLDAAYEAGAVNTASNWGNFMLLNDGHGAAPLATTASLIAANNATPYTITGGINLPNYTVTGDVLRFVNIRLTGEGALTLGGVANLGSITLNGNTSGGAIIQPQATAGTPTLTLPNASGTFAVSATSPLALSATTGALTCATCVTSAASLTANQLVVGSGSQGEQTLGQLGTATTVLHGNAGGLPSFVAVSLTADVTGTLPVANGGTNYTGGAYGAYTATVTPGSGSITTQASSSAFLQIGKIVFAEIQVTISNIGTAAGTVTINMPVAAKRAAVCLGRDAGVSGNQLSLQMSASVTAAQAFVYNAGNPAYANGMVLAFTCEYEAA